MPTEVKEKRFFLHDHSCFEGGDIKPFPPIYDRIDEITKGVLICKVCGQNSFDVVSTSLAPHNKNLREYLLKCAICNGELMVAEYINN